MTSQNISHENTNCIHYELDSNELQRDWALSIIFAAKDCFNKASIDSSYLKMIIILLNQMVIHVALPG